MKNTFFTERGFKEIPIPVALCVTKMDKNSNFINNPVDFGIESYAEELLGQTAFRTVKANLSVHKFFGVSSVGWDDEGKKNYFLNKEGDMCPVGEPKPVNVIDALEWLLKNRPKK